MLGNVLEVFSTRLLEELEVMVVSGSIVVQFFIP
jgi:hypothetical protein